MIESAIINKLAADAALTALLSTYGVSPAIFSEEAPENAKEPYITIRLMRNSGPDSIIELFSLYVDYWDLKKSRVASRSAIERIEFVLDNAVLDHDRYSSIRIWHFSAGPVEGTDPRDIHHNIQFEIRACRKKWIRQIYEIPTTTTTTFSP